MAAKPTIKQEKFAQSIADGDPAVVAYRKHYSTENSTDSTTAVNAHRLRNNPKVTPLIEAAKARNDRGNERSLGNRRRWILDGLIREAEDEDNPAASRVKSLELLGKMAGMFDTEKERSEKREHATEEQLEAELIQRLSEIVDKPIEVIEVTDCNQKENDDLVICLADSEPRSPENLPEEPEKEGHPPA